jgi:hypothetical protein
MGRKRVSLLSYRGPRRGSVHVPPMVLSSSLNWLCTYHSAMLDLPTLLWPEHPANTRVGAAPRLVVPRCTRTNKDQLDRQWLARRAERPRRAVAPHRRARRPRRAALLPRRLRHHEIYARVGPGRRATLSDVRAGVWEPLSP